MCPIEEMHVVLIRGKQKNCLTCVHTATNTRSNLVIMV